MLSGSVCGAKGALEGSGESVAVPRQRVCRQRSEFLCLGIDGSESVSDGILAARGFSKC